MTVSGEVLDGSVHTAKDPHTESRFILVKGLPGTYRTNYRRTVTNSVTDDDIS